MDQMTGAAALDRERLHNRIVREVIARVAEGRYPPGFRLPSERVLCREFDVARGTLRKALAELAALDVLQISPNRGAYVRNLTPAGLPRDRLPPDLADVSLADVLQARLAIETAALDRAVRRIGPAGLGRLRRLIDRMAAALDDLPRFLSLDIAFHREIVKASGNPVLVRSFEAIRDYHRFSAVYTARREGLEAQALEYHRRLVQALARRDAPAGRRILAGHLRAVARAAAAGERAKKRKGPRP